MKTKQDFITEFVLRTMTNPHVGAISAATEDQMLRWAISLANKAWDAIQPAQAANQPLEGYSAGLVALARDAVMLSKRNAQWITIDKNGDVWAFEFRPDIHEAGVGWTNINTGGPAWGMHTVAPPADFTKECYRISDILASSDNSPEFDSENLVAQSEKIIKEAKDVLARIPPSVPNLKALARKAVQKSHGAAKWLTIDADGEVNAFDLKPNIDQYSKDMWVAFDPYSESGWLIGNVPPPSDFTQECYEIEAILNAK